MADRRAPGPEEGREATKGVIVVHVEASAPSPAPPGPCPVAGAHRWAWLTDGRQACGYCGRPR